MSRQPQGRKKTQAGDRVPALWYRPFTAALFWRPFFGGSKAIHRYQMAQQATRATKPDTVVGHSLGGAVALQMQEEDPRLQARTYGAPVFDPLGTNPGERSRSRFDPISIFDRGATSTLDAPAANVSGFHSYEATGSRTTSSGDGKVVPGAVSITE